MKRDDRGRPGRRMTGPSVAGEPRRASRRPPTIEPLEGRTLLSQGAGFLPRAIAHTAGGAAYLIQVTGPGVVNVAPIGHGEVAINLFGTTPASQVTVTPRLIRPRFAGTFLQIGRLNVHSGQLGSFQALNTADLVGPATPLQGAVQSLQFDALGGNVQLEADGGLGQLNVANNANLPAGGGVLINGPATIGGSVTNAGRLETANLTIGGSLTDSGTVTASTVSIGGNVTEDGTFTGGATTIGGNLVDDGSFTAGNLNVGGALIDAGRLSATGITTGGSFLITSTSPVALTSAGTLSVGGDLDIGPGASLHIAGDRSAPITVTGSVNLNGGQFAVDRDVLFGIQIGGNLTAANGGALNVGRDLLGGTFNSNSSSTSLTSSSNGSGSTSTISGGGTSTTTSSTTSGNGSTTTITSTASTSTTINGLVVTGNVLLASGGAINVGRDISALTVTGSVDTSGGGKINVGGNIDAFTVTGILRGRYVPTASNVPLEPASAADINVGLDLDNLKVTGGVQNQGAIQNLDLNVGKNIFGIQVNHGIFNSLITAGVLIDGAGSTTPAPTSNVGPDGNTSVFDSTILATSQIRNLTITGDVLSDMPTNPARVPTRISAGLDRFGNLTSGANLANFQITGALIDAVLSAAVRPFGGNGTVVTPGSGTATAGDLGFDTYDKPAGTQTFGFSTNPVTVPNFTAPPYDRSGADPTVDDLVYPGAINRSFAPPSLPPGNNGNSVTVTTGPTGVTTTSIINNGNGTQTITIISPAGTTTQTVPVTPIPIVVPSKSTVLGGVISTPHGDQADFAGIFAADTSGVFVGALPNYTGATAAGTTTA